MPELTLVNPLRLRYAGAEVRVGETVYRALSALRNSHGRLGSAKLCARVWGSPCSSTAVKGLVQRVNAALRKVGCPTRATRDRAMVRLV